MADEFADLQFIVLSGPSGSGKTTIVERLLEVSPVRLVKSISATTRGRRENEVQGRDYYFLTREEFGEKRKNGEFLECAEVHSSGNWYGTLKSEVRRARELGGWSLLEIDVQGAAQIVEKYPRALTIFVQAADMADYEKRLRARGTESDEVISRRLDSARRELDFAPRYQYQVVNANLDSAVGDICRILAEWEAQATCSKT